MTNSDQTVTPRAYLCTVIYVVNGTWTVGQPFVWQAASPEHAAEIAAGMLLGPDCERHRIVVAPIAESRHFRWTGTGKVERERTAWEVTGS